MICPYCRNDKLDAAICPGCGLGEKEAVLKAADLYWAEGRQELAVEYYGRYLTVEPGDFDVACKRASYLCAMARERRDPKLFEMADGQIARILEGRWDWQAGHQARVDLYFSFGKLDSLLGQYQKAAEEPDKAEVSAEMVRLIRLVMRFKEEKPEIPENLKGEEETSRVVESFWPLLLAIIFSLALSVFFPAGSGGVDDEGSRKLSMFQQLVIILALAGSGFYGIWRYQKYSQGDKPKKPKGPRPTLEP